MIIRACRENWKSLVAGRLMNPPNSEAVKIISRPFEQKCLALIHKSSSVGARPSSAAPFEQKSLDPIHASSSVRHGVIEVVLFEGGGRGRPRSDRRALVY